MTNTDTTWATPTTWAAGDPLTASNVNAQLRDKLNALKTPASFYAYIDEVADYTIASSVFASVDTTDLHGAITTAGGLVLVGFSCTVRESVAMFVNFDILVDGARIGGDDGILQDDSGGAFPTAISATRIISGLGAGAHTFELQWKNSTGTATMYAGAGTGSAGDIHPTFWGVELASTTP